MSFVSYVAAAEAGAGEGGLTQALGLHLDQLLVNAGAFLLLLAILAKFVYPVLIKSIDDRRKTIEEGLAEAKKSQAAGEEAERTIAALLADARKDADEVISRSQQEAASLVANAEAKAKQRADQIVSDARAQLDIEVGKARTALKRDTMQLVALATEKVIDEKLDDKKDGQLVEAALSKGRS